MDGRKKKKNREKEGRKGRKGGKGREKNNHTAIASGRISRRQYWHKKVITHVEYNRAQK